MPKQSYHALQAMSERLAGTQYRCDLREKLAMGPDEHAYLFERDGEEDVLVLWSTAWEGSGVRLRDVLEKVGQATSVRDYLGSDLDLQDDQGFGPEPLYLTLPR